MRASGLRLHRAYENLTHYQALVSLLGQSHADREIGWMVTHLIESQSPPSPGKNMPQRSDALNSLLQPHQISQLQEFIHARAIERKPLQYILGSVQFLSLPLRTRAPVLIPRPETESMVAWSLSQWKHKDYRQRYPHLSVTHEKSFADIMEWMKPAAESSSPAPSSTQLPFRVVDLCSGSGNISLSLFHHLRRFISAPLHVVGVDINEKAIELAQENLQALKNLPSFNNQLSGSKCQFVQMDLMAEQTESLSPEEILLQQFQKQQQQHQGGDLSFSSLMLHPPHFLSTLRSLLNDTSFSCNFLISNPPYIPLAELSDLEEEVKTWEDSRALISGVEGNDLTDVIVQGARSLLEPPGVAGASKSGLILPGKRANPASSSDNNVFDTSSWDVPELVFEIGNVAQAMHWTVQLPKYGFRHVTVHHDLAGLPRWIAAARFSEPLQKS